MAKSERELSKLQEQYSEAENGEGTITYEQFIDPTFRRAEQMKVKSEATWVAFNELDGLLNVSKLAKKYFHRSHGWFSQKLNGYCVCKKERAFTTEEYSQLTASLRDIAKRLTDYADAIDAAEE
jgi:hypothetical protein